eukprot:m.237366 g.237366  ORF g.237366 m.237366 type:complete len:112 (-) comp54333_c0_seq6:172-507(-)
MFSDCFSHLISRGFGLFFILASGLRCAVPQCRALYPYSKSQEDEIELQCVILIFLAMFSPGTFSRLTLIPTVPLRREGDVIDILSSEDEVWWHGRCNGIEGLFPATYVERI